MRESFPPFLLTFTDYLTQKLTEKVMGYFHSCTSELDPSITLEYELNPLNGLDAAVATVVPDDEPSKKYAVLLFRGSDEISDWLINLNFGLTDASYGPVGTQVHGGFYNTIFSRFGKILEYKKMKLLSDDSYEDTLFIIGYSAGGKTPLDHLDTFIISAVWTNFRLSHFLMSSKLD